jgi:hypothetical protein
VKPVWYDHNADNQPWIKALADVRRMGTLEGSRRSTPLSH